MGKDINQAKLIGGKRKNGHKSNCTCHICENMKNKAITGGYEQELEKEKEKMMGGSKKKNGHRRDCECPICKNMKNSKKVGGSKYIKRTKKMRGGDDDNSEKERDEMDDEQVEESVSDFDGGKKKKNGNGHKPNCQCPICKNMRKKKGRQKKGGDFEEELGDIEEAGIKATNNNQKMSISETKATDEDYDILDAAEKGEAGQNVVGGTRKRRGGKKWGGKKWGGRGRSITRKLRKYN
jgi:hypothetical protein